MARPPKAYHSRGAWRTDFNGVKNRVLVRGPKNAETRLKADKELLRLREEARLVQQLPGLDTPFAVVVEQFLAAYAGRPAYQDFGNELHWFMGLDLASDPDRPTQRAGNNVAHGGRFGVPCKSWPIRRINAEVVEGYLRRRKTAGLSGYHAFVTLRTLMNWAVKKKFLTSHDLDQVDAELRRKGRRHYLPADADVVRVFQGADGHFKELLLVYMTTGIRPSELRTVRIDEFDRENRQWVLWRHKTVHRTGRPKIVPLATEAVYRLCVSSAASRESDQMLFLNSQKEPWTYNALRLRWYRLRNKLGLDRRFTLYSLRHWFITIALESGESEALVGELAGHVDRATIDYYKKLRNGPLHQAATRVAGTIARAGIEATPQQPAG
jgi:integrase